MRNQKGAITLFVLLAMLFFMIALINIYMIVANRAQTQIRITGQTGSMYSQDVKMAEDIYQGYFGEGVIPIYTVDELLKIASNKNVIINEEGGKIYKFAPESTYVLRNDLEFDANEQGLSNNWVPIHEQIEQEVIKGKFEWSGYTITVINLSGIIIRYPQ